MTDVLSQDDQAACAREAFAAIEAVLDRRCPEMKIAFWTAVDKLYRLDSSRGRQPEAASSPSPDVPPPTQAR